MTGIARSLLLLAGLVVALGVVVPANAHIASFERFSWGLHYPKNLSTASGTITCARGERYVVTLRTFQKETEYRASGRTTGTCTGSEQQWGEIVTLADHTGDLRCEFRTRFTLVAETSVEGQLHDSATLAWTEPAQC